VQLPSARYPDSAQSAEVYSRMQEKISALPGVRDAAAVSFLPLAGLGIGTSYYRTDQPEPPPGELPSTNVRPITPNWFRTMGIPQVAGRDFTDADREEGPQVAIVSESLAARTFPGENPIGRHILVRIKQPGGVDYEIVGIVGDIKMTSLEAAAGPAVYVPHRQLAIGLMTFVVRTDLDPGSLVSGVSAAVRSIDAEVPLADVKTMEGVVDSTIARPRVIATLLTAFAVIALLLAGVGVYGVMAYAVTERTHEIGVRMALGATRESVMSLVVGQAARLVLTGIAIGLAGAVALTRVLSSLLYETDARDPWTLGLTAIVLVSVALLAALVPALRGTRISPTQALRVQ
jgi:putative ABC transport system permease protein